MSGNVTSILSRVLETTGARWGYVEEIVAMDGRPHRGRVWASPACEGPAPAPDTPFSPIERREGFGRRALAGFVAVGKGGTWSWLFRSGSEIQARLVIGGARRPQAGHAHLVVALEGLHRALPVLVERSEMVRVLLTDEGRLLCVRPVETQPSLIAAIRSGPLEAGVRTIDGAPVWTERLEDGEGRPTWLVSVGSPQPYRLSPVSLLTDMQREVALSAANGATVPEIARSLGRTRETVRTHLRAIYNQLEICSRVELCRMFLDLQAPGHPLPPVLQERAA